jgi:hypothetical protein
MISIFIKQDKHWRLIGWGKIRRGVQLEVSDMAAQSLDSALFESENADALDKMADSVCSVCIFLKLKLCLWLTSNLPFGLNRRLVKATMMVTRLPRLLQLMLRMLMMNKFFVSDQNTDTSFQFSHSFILRVHPHLNCLLGCRSTELLPRIVLKRQSFESVGSLQMECPQMQKNRAPTIVLEAKS